tara:strand:- start:7 stop:201 length:195 start_codon:yes stop_codon:yes gene_type:complete
MVSNMKELCEYNRQKKLARKTQHIEIIKIYGECKGMGSRWYKSPQKSSFPKQYKAAYNKIWRNI